MLKTIQDAMHKSCLIGLSYFDVEGNQLKQNIIAGRVIKVDSSIGLTVELFTNQSEKENSTNKAHFILPTDLSCWFTAPKGEYHTSQAGVKIINPDYLVTWDIYQTKKQNDASSQDGEQQWWQWQPRVQKPNVG
jgi:hypothetical protein